MADNNQLNIHELAEKWAQGTITPEEQALLEKWYSGFNDENITLTDSRHSNSEELRAAMLAKISDGIAEELVPVRNIQRWPRIVAAASVLLACSVGGYFVLHQKQQPVQAAVIKPGIFKNDALPGNKAILTFANGQQLAVTSIPAGHINNTNIQKTVNGALVYDQSNAAPDVYNILTVPRGGGKHELKLADGTLAILDAGSSIRFPVAFNGKERKVSITGQVYFEVVHNASQPFYVAVNNQIIEDVGTHFNINAFDGEVKTTLLEGSIKVNHTLLKPGQQAVQQADGQFSVLNQVDEEEVIAWKNDLFKFNKNTSLQTVMNQLSRWYDLNVVYEGSAKSYRFGGYVPRNSKLSEVCKILEYSGVKFSVDGKKIIVYQ